MPQPSVSIAVDRRDTRPSYAAARSLSWLLIAVASWTCGGGDTHPAPPPPTTGTLMVTVLGLPPGASAQGSITGPGGFNAPLTGTAVVPGARTRTRTPSRRRASRAAERPTSPARKAAVVVAGQIANVGVTYSRVENPRSESRRWRNRNRIWPRYLIPRGHRLHDHQRRRRRGPAARHSPAAPRCNSSWRRARCPAGQMTVPAPPDAR